MTARSGSIRVGTSGFDYKDWYGEGAFFPPTLKPQHRLQYYAQRFNTVELNITFYQLLSEGAVGGLINKVNTGFHFVLKAHRDLTHGTRRNAQETMAKFRGTVDWFRQAEQLGGVLVQLPARVDGTPKNKDYLHWLVDSLAQNARRPGISTPPMDHRNEVKSCDVIGLFPCRFLSSSCFLSQCRPDQ